MLANCSIALGSRSPRQVPEQRDIVTDEDLAEFARKREEAERRAAGSSALGGFAVGARCTAQLRASALLDCWP